MRRAWLKWVSVLLAGVIVVAPLAGWLALHASLPRYDGIVSTPSVSTDVDVERDALGTATFRARNRTDLAFALGYVHAQERFFEMDLQRRRAAGELAELFGAAALPLDRSARAHGMRARAIEEVAHLAPDRHAEVDAYRDGVNAGLNALAVRPFPYLLTQSSPQPWRSEDTMLVVAAMAFTLNDAENVRELANARMRAALPDSVYHWLSVAGGSWDAPLLGGSLADPAMPDASAIDLRSPSNATSELTAAPQNDARAERMPGSNAFAVGGALTHGAALVANDMHLELRVPSIWFRARFLYPDPDNADAAIDVTGATLPGTPAMIVGSNGHIAWGFTNAYIDVTDWVRVEKDPSDANRYRTADGWTSISKHAETIHVHGAEDETLDIEDTRWGPILAKDVDGTPLALAWTAQQPGAFDLELERLERATSATQAVEIAKASGLPPENFIVGDRDGHVAWTIAGRIPRRIGGFDPTLPADWSKPGTGWDGWLDHAAYPLVFDPDDARIWSANQRAVGDGPLAIVGDGGYDIGARAGQIRDDLAARSTFTPADMLAVQLDDRALFIARWKELLVRELDHAPTAAWVKPMRAALDDWNGRASVDSVAYRVVRAWRVEVINRVLDGFTTAIRSHDSEFKMPHLAQAEYIVWPIVEQRPPNLLPATDSDWDALLLGAAKRVFDQLEAKTGSIAKRTWGERNTTHIAHPLSRALPGFVAKWLDMPRQQLPGDSDMPRVQAPEFGASERFAVAPGDEAHGYFMLAGGQSGHPLSPYYGAGHKDWAEGRPTPFLPGPAEHHLHFVAAQ